MDFTLLYNTAKKQGIDLGNPDKIALSGRSAEMVAADVVDKYGFNQIGVVFSENTEVAEIIAKKLPGNVATCQHIDDLDNHSGKSAIIYMDFICKKNLPIVASIKEAMNQKGVMAKAFAASVCDSHEITDNIPIGLAFCIGSLETIKKGIARAPGETRLHNGAGTIIGGENGSIRKQGQAEIRDGGAEPAAEQSGGRSEDEVGPGREGGPGDDEFSKHEAESGGHRSAGEERPVGVDAGATAFSAEADGWGDKKPGDGGAGAGTGDAVSRSEIESRGTPTPVAMGGQPGTETAPEAGPDPGPGEPASVSGSGGGDGAGQGSAPAGRGDQVNRADGPGGGEEDNAGEAGDPGKEPGKEASKASGTTDSESKEWE